MIVIILWLSIFLQNAEANKIEVNSETAKICITVEFGPGLGYEEVSLPVFNGALQQGEKSECSSKERREGDGKPNFHYTGDRELLMNIYNSTAQNLLEENVKKRLKVSFVEKDEKFWDTWIVIMETIVNQLEYALFHRAEIRQMYNLVDMKTLNEYAAPSCIIVTSSCNSRITYQKHNGCTQFGRGLIDVGSKTDMEFLFGESRLSHVTIDIGNMPNLLENALEIQQAIFNVMKSGASLQFYPDDSAYTATSSFFQYNKHTFLKPFNVETSIKHSWPKFSSRLINTYVINLSNRERKWRNFSNHHETMLSNISKYSAVDGTSPLNMPWIGSIRSIFGEFTDMNKVSQNHQNPHGIHAGRRGTVGCALSHLQIWLEIATSSLMGDSDYVLILEDDAFFESKLDWFTIQERINKDPRWDVLFLGHSDMDISDILYNDWNLHIFPGVKVMNSVPRSYGAGLYAYCIRKKTALMLREHILGSGNQVQQPLDWFLFDAVASSLLVAYKLYPPVVTTSAQQQSKSSDTYSHFPYAELFRHRKCEGSHQELNSKFIPTAISISNIHNASNTSIDMRIRLSVSIKPGISVHEFNNAHKCTKICTAIRHTGEFQNKVCNYLDKDMWIDLAPSLITGHAHVKAWLETAENRVLRLEGGQTAAASVHVTILPPIHIQVNEIGVLSNGKGTIHIAIGYSSEFISLHSAFSVCFGEINENIEYIYGCHSITRILKPNDEKYFVRSSDSTISQQLLFRWKSTSFLVYALDVAARKISIPITAHIELPIGTTSTLFNIDYRFIIA